MLSLSAIGSLILLSFFVFAAMLIALPRLIARRDARAHGDEPEQPQG